jgi:hypothetical protein
MTRVREDVQRRNAMFDRHDGWKFELHEDDGQFEVSRIVASGSTRSTVNAAVRFERAGRRIHVQGENVDVEFTAIVTLDASSSAARISRSPPASGERSRIWAEHRRCGRPPGRP